ncbi:hypothetical protein GQ42DRAFT_163190 [Ramicandelaber brevisporus]|nr:hypothetical protein GQ42DRAFT_163190 [Ramicandelaber brevisporus]
MKLLILLLSTLAAAVSASWITIYENANFNGLQHTLTFSPPAPGSCIRLDVPQSLIEHLSSARWASDFYGNIGFDNGRYWHHSFSFSSKDYPADMSKNNWIEMTIYIDVCQTLQASSSSSLSSSASALPSTSFATSSAAPPSPSSSGSPTSSVAPTPSSFPRPYSVTLFDQAWYRGNGYTFTFPMPANDRCVNIYVPVEWSTRAVSADWVSNGFNGTIVFYNKELRGPYFEFEDWWRPYDFQYQGFEGPLVSISICADVPLASSTTPSPTGPFSSTKNPTPTPSTMPDGPFVTVFDQAYWVGANQTFIFEKPDNNKCVRISVSNDWTTRIISATWNYDLFTGIITFGNADGNRITMKFDGDIRPTNIQFSTPKELVYIEICRYDQIQSSFISGSLSSSSPSSTTASSTSSVASSTSYISSSTPSSETSSSYASSSSPSVASSTSYTSSSASAVPTTSSTGPSTAAIVYLYDQTYWRGNSTYVLFEFPSSGCVKTSVPLEWMGKTLSAKWTSNHAGSLNFQFGQFFGWGTSFKAQEYPFDFTLINRDRAPLVEISVCAPPPPLPSRTSTIPRPSNIPTTTDTRPPTTRPPTVAPTTVIPPPTTIPSPIATASWTGTPPPPPPPPPSFK